MNLTPYIQQNTSIYKYISWITTYSIHQTTTTQQQLNRRHWPCNDTTTTTNNNDQDNAPTTTTNAAYMWYHLRVWMTRHSRAWALNNAWVWMTQCVYLHTTQQQQLQWQRQLCLNHLWHTPQLGQQRHNDNNNEINNIAYIIIFIYIYKHSPSFTSIYNIWYKNKVK